MENTACMGDGKTFRKTKITGDGNCLFRAISKAMYNTEDEHIKLRKDAVKHIHESKEKYKPYIDTSFDKHIQNMAHTDGLTESWGTEAEILALTEILQRSIEVYSKTGEKFVKQTLCFSEDHTATPEQAIVLFHTFDQHIHSHVHCYMSVDFFWYYPFISLHGQVFSIAGI